MGKPEMEIQSVDHVPWGTVGSGMWEKILSKDPKTGNLTRIVKVEPGVETTEVSSHDVWEETYVLEGEFIDKGKNITLAPGMYGCRPPGIKHGPYSFPKGALILEFRYRT